VEAAGQLVSEMLTAANGLSFAGRAQMMGAIEQQTSKLASLRMGGALTEAISPTGCNVNNFLEACFTGEMLLDVEGGKKRADEIRVGDKLWSRSEFEPEGSLALKEVEEVFVRTARVLNVRVGEQLIRTTAEHPFWVVNRGKWLPAGMLEVGDRLQTRNDSLVSVEAVEDSGQVETVYNWRVKDYHTYFVGSEELGFGVWAHNNDGCVHRVGGGDASNLALKPHEAKLDPPGISVLIGGTPAETAADFRRVFGPKSSLGKAARTVGTADIEKIQAAGFDVIPVPTNNFPNHGRIIHPTEGAAGFTPENLQILSQAFTNTTGL
jgi:hypothetical protein